MVSVISRGTARETCGGMRLVIWTILTFTSLSRADVPPPDVTLRMGMHHTSIDKDDGAPNGYGPRTELEVALQPIPWISAGLVGAYSYYSSSQLYCGVLHESYDVAFHEMWAGLRVYVHPHWRLFAGGTVWRQWERETATMVAMPDWSARTTAELVAGANVARLDNYLVQIAATYSAYSQFDHLEHVAVWSLSLGLTRCGRDCFASAR